MHEQLYPVASRELAQQRTQLAPEISTAFKAFGAAVFADGALPRKTKQLIAVAAAHVTQCPYCIRGHTELAVKHGATEQEVMEAIWLTLPDFVVHSFCPPMEEAMSRLGSQLS